VTLQQVASNGATIDGLIDLLGGILASWGGLDTAAIAKNYWSVLAQIVFQQCKDIGQM